VAATATHHVHRHPKGSTAEHNHPDERLDPSHPEEATHFHIGWLPNLVNIRLDQGWVRVKANLAAMKDGDADAKERFITGLFSVLPQTMLVLLPIFALLLKIVYIFRRRLYMEHMIVALHSHAFIFVSLFLLVLVGMAKSWAQGAAPWLVGWLNLLLFVMGWWLPIYLFLMQKKVYKQGWIMTMLKYGMIGTCYTILISCCAAAAFLVSLATV